ncbi:uncharacterized protein CANTADRAFT_25843 [Suhomyces tanzawaensis NRRL Y-17324]|uniref:Kinetochore protein SPC25 n=1 Tax=Suhomyces tanzawaensis NRRL Y-17324 TaxID=984487 RepID=A0A1E4SKU8_9ASCO|nr:uncharacterized protein CANTADRAFT_25843 [Suhomyces tanzawaensis NRRL Y-17324]ODV80131.1 hypothetical protein CANTADRAFT_25843 [Suhomyces tanzawaensis NRRL Y-17324]
MATQTSIEEFSVLQAEMKEFSAQIERKLTEKRAQLISEKQEHYIKVNELRSEEARLQNDITNLESKESKTKENLRGALEGLRAQRDKVDELIRKQEQLVDQRNELQQLVSELQKSIQESTHELERSEKSLTTQIRRDYPELLKFEQYLGLRIEAVSIDLIRFVFTNIDTNDFDREFWIQVNVGSETYKVGPSNPEVSPEQLTKLETDFNAHKELVRFLKAARNLFKEMA